MIKLLFVQKFYFLYQVVFAKSNAIRIVNRRSENVNNKLDNNKRRSALSCKTTPAPALPPLLYEYYFSST